MSFADLKRNSASNFEKLTNELSKMASTRPQDPLEEKLWKPTLDKAGNGFAVIRFMPAPEGEDIPFVRIWDHGFQGPGGWYIEKSLTTFSEKDPVGELNSKLWSTGLDSDKEIARKQKRRLSYYSNVYIVKDPGNPENEGKVFIFKFGKKIFDKLNDLMNPSFEDEQPVDPFNLWTGANFRLKVRKVENFPNYDKSEFDTPGALLDDDDKLEEIYNSLYSLQELLDRKHFKTYEELNARLNRVLGNSAASSDRNRSRNQETTPWKNDEDEAPKQQFKETESKSTESDDDDDLEDFFKTLNDD